MDTLENVVWKVVTVLYVGVRSTVVLAIGVLEGMDWALHKYGFKL
jgi:hypothetical protein